MGSWLDKSKKVKNKSSEKRRKFVNDKIKRKKSAMKYVKKTKLVPQIKKADSRGELIDLLQNVDNEVEELIEKYNPEAWAGTNKESQRKKKASKNKIDQNKNPFANATKGQGKNIDLSHIGNGQARNSKATNMDEDDEDPAGQWSMQKLSSMGNNGQGQVPGFSKQ